MRSYLLAACADDLTLSYIPTPESMRGMSVKRLDAWSAASISTTEGTQTRDGISVPRA
jgi:hypothetical protein